MVKNRALKRDARVIKASAGITYPRARDLLTVPIDHDDLVPSLSLGYDADGKDITYRPGKGTVLIIEGPSGFGKSVLLNRLASEAADVAAVYLIDPVKNGADYQRLHKELSALETTAAGALALVKRLAAPRHTASLLIIDEIGCTGDIPGFGEALLALSDSGLPIIIGGQQPHRFLSPALRTRAELMILGDRYTVDYKAPAGNSQVVLPPCGEAPEPDFRFEFGTEVSDHHPVAFVPAKDLNLFVSGPVGSGKTTFLNALAADAAVSMDVYYSNAAFPSDEIRPPAPVRRMTSHQETADVLDELLEEISDRRAACHEAGVGTVAELSEPPRPILIVLDDFHWLTYHENSAMELPELRPLRARIAAAIGKIARESRTARVSLVMASQSDDALKLIPGESRIRGTLSRLELGALKSPAPWGSDPLRDRREIGRPNGIYQQQSRRGVHVDVRTF